MDQPSVTYTGQEVAIIAGLIAGSMPDLYGDDFMVAENLLDKALSALPRPLSPDIEAMIERMRAQPLDRFWRRLTDAMTPGQPFNIISASFAGQCRPSAAHTMLELLAQTKSDLRRVDDHLWTIKGD